VDERDVESELADLWKLAAALISTTEKAIDEYAADLSAWDVAELQEDIESLKRTKDTRDGDRLRNGIARLEFFSSQILASIGPQAVAGALGMTRDGHPQLVNKESTPSGAPAPRNPRPPLRLVRKPEE
jgi:hypothetical protein